VREHPPKAERSSTRVRIAQRHGRGFDPSLRKRTGAPDASHAARPDRRVPQPRDAGRRRGPEVALDTQREAKCDARHPDGAKRRIGSCGRRASVTLTTVLVPSRASRAGQCIECDDAPRDLAAADLSPL
jgi:hypothetical protein